MPLLMNEKIKASEVDLIGLAGEQHGILPLAEALKLAKQHNADLVCTSMLKSPPPCQLMARGQAKQQKNKEQSKDVVKKTKEIRLTAHIEDHDYDTKLRQCETLLQSGHPVALIVKVQGKNANDGKQVIESLLQDLKHIGKKETGIQVSGKQVNVTVLPLA